jgi:1-acyl-sn-glycerol-3-phosphate acyltransferase
MRALLKKLSKRLLNTSIGRRVTSLFDLLAVRVGKTFGWVARTCCKPNVEWRGRLPATGDRIFIFNHTSHADSVLVWTSLPASIRKTVRFVAAEDYWTLSQLRRFIAERVFRAIFVKRDASTIEARQDQVDRIVSQMVRGDSILLAPEGTRGDGTEVKDFKSGIYYLSLANPRFVIIPVYLENLQYVLPKGQFIPTPKPCRVVFGDPIRLRPKETRKEFLTRARQSILDLA